MKKVGVLLHSLTLEYAISILTGISDFFKEKEIKLVIAQVKSPNYDIGLYEYQCWSATSYLFSEQIDGLIVISGSFSSAIQSSNICDVLKEFPNKPTISLNAKLNIPNSSFLNVESFSAYDKIIKILKHENKQLKIAYMTSEDRNSEEAKERYDSFIKAMKNNNLTFNESLLFYGSFSQNSGYMEMKKRYPKKKDINFNTIFAANDLMAIGIKTYLEELGVKIPKEINIIGYDNSTHSETVSPKLTTIDQFFYEQGIIAAESILKKINNKNIPDVINFQARPVYRESCGFTSKQTYRRNTNQLLSNGILGHFLGKLDTIYNLFDLSKASVTLQRLFYSLPYMIEKTNIYSIALSFFDEPIILGKKDKFILPDKIELRILIDRENDIAEFEPNIVYNPQKSILPDNIFDSKKGKYILQPVFSGEKNYGILVCKIYNDDYGIYPVFLKIITNAIVQSFEYTQTIEKNHLLSEENKELIEHNSSLSEESRTDELTKILNRRGFIELGQRSIEMSLALETKGLVLFADMDGLKTINDTYGHKMGDNAIKSMASILTQALRANDVVARLGGDEFACIAGGMELSHLQNVRDKINILSKECIEKHNYPFNLSISIGAIEFTKNNSSLKELLLEADKLLYQEKKEKHTKREN